MFFRTSENSEGSGLSLYIVKQALEALKVSIRFEGKAGIGTQFVITIPVTEFSLPYKYWFFCKNT
jgi:signal transduction histidine kinase